jgi:hypothetical protein
VARCGILIARSPDRRATTPSTRGRKADPRSGSAPMQGPPLPVVRSGVRGYPRPSSRLCRCGASGLRCGVDEHHEERHAHDEGDGDAMMAAALLRLPRAQPSGSGGTDGRRTSEGPALPHRRGDDAMRGSLPAMVCLFGPPCTTSSMQKRAVPTARSTQRALMSTPQARRPGPARPAPTRCSPPEKRRRAHRERARSH